MDLKLTIEQRLARSPKLTFTIENGSGQTYRNGKPTLYAHDHYPRTSVLGGQPRRTWIDEFTTWDEARTARAALPANLKRKVELLDGGSTFISADALCDAAGLPHDEDY